MDRDITRFRGCLKGIYNFRLNQELIDMMLEKNIIYIPIEQSHFIFGESEEMFFIIRFNGLVYFANDDILLDIYQQCVCIMFELQIEEEAFVLNEIKKNIFSFIDNEERIKYLKVKRKQLIDSLPDNQIDFYRSYEEFYDNIYSQKIYDWDIIKSYDFGRSFEYIIRNTSDSSDYFFYENHFYDIPEDYKELFKKFRQTKYQLDFIRKKIFELENDEPKKNKVGFENATQKMILLKSIIKSKNWNELSINKKSRILEPILGYHKDTISNAIDVLDPNKITANKKGLDKDKKVVEEYLKKLGVSLGDLTD